MLHTFNYTTSELNIQRRMNEIAVKLANSDEVEDFRRVAAMHDLAAFGAEGAEARKYIQNQSLADEALAYIEKHPKVSYADALTMLERQHAGRV